KIPIRPQPLARRRDLPDAPVLDHDPHRSRERRSLAVEDAVGLDDGRLAEREARGGQTENESEQAAGHRSSSSTKLRTRAIASCKFPDSVRPDDARGLKEWPPSSIQAIRIALESG